MKPFALSHILLPLFLTTGLSLQGFCQPSDHRSDRIVWLMNGDTLYSRHLQVWNPDTTEKFLILDNDRKIPIHLVSRFRGLHGTYVVLPGSIGIDIYKVEKEGPHISVYSRTLYEAPVDSTGAHPVAMYFRKPGQPQMNLLTYQSLLHAMADNPDAQHQLHLTKTHLRGGLVITLLSATLTGIGLYESYRAGRKKTSPPPDNNPVWPPPPPPPHSTSLSPLIFIGAGGMAAGLVVTFGAHKHEMKALNIYNQ